MTSSLLEPPAAQTLPPGGFLMEARRIDGSAKQEQRTQEMRVEEEEGSGPAKSVP